MIHLALLKTNRDTASKKRFLISNEMRPWIEKNPKAMKHKATLHRPALMRLNPLQKSKETEPSLSFAFPSLLFLYIALFTLWTPFRTRFSSRLTYPLGSSDSGQIQKFVNINKYKVVSMAVITNSSLSGKNALKILTFSKKKKKSNL